MDADELIHAGAATSTALGLGFVLIPGLLPSLAIAGVIAAVAAVPALAVAIAGAVLGGPPYLAWRLLVRGRRARAAAEGRLHTRTAPSGSVR